MSCVDVRRRRRRLYVNLSAVVHARTHARGGTTLPCVYVRGVRQRLQLSVQLCVWSPVRTPGELRFKRNRLGATDWLPLSPLSCSHTVPGTAQHNESVDRSSFSSVGSLFHARGAATEKALLPIRRRVRGTTRLPHDEACSVDRPGILATNVRRSEIYSGVYPRSNLWTSADNDAVTSLRDELTKAFAKWTKNGSSNRTQLPLLPVWPPPEGQSLDIWPCSPHLKQPKYPQKEIHTDSRHFPNAASPDCTM